MRGPAFSDMLNRKTVTGIFAVASVYFYFLLFAQFSFLKLLQSRLPSPEALDWVMGVMGGCGLLSSLLSYWLIKHIGKEKLLLLSFVGAAATASLSPTCTSLAQFIICSSLIGSFLALATVSLASQLARFFPRDSLGVFTGLGTGIAYFCCNIPALFNAPPPLQCAASALAIVLATILIWRANPDDLPNESGSFTVCDLDYKFPGFVLILGSFLTLVWLDSAAFFVIQHTTVLKAQTWAGAERLWFNALVHFLSSLLSGLLLDRGFLRSLLLWAFLLLAAAVIALELQEPWAEVSGLLYCAGVSLYSTLLVAFPSRQGDKSALIPRAARAAFIFGIAGWLGSALGIGMAKDLHTVPPEFILTAAVLLLLFTLVKKPPNESGSLFAPLMMLLLLISVEVPNSLVHLPTGENSDLSPEEVGRKVYISEGCIHCHSQYVRPNTKDALLWGPYQKPEKILAASPPLIGNRRNGPDLLNVGSRRTKEWLAEHFQNPQGTSPGSTMPSYDYLFHDRRGAQLLSYVLSLKQQETTNPVHR